MIDLFIFRLPQEEAIMVLPDEKYSPFVRGTEYMLRSLKDAFEREDLTLVIIC